MQTKLLLISGPPGAGKTTAVKRLQALDERFVYIRPYTTRPLRANETDKISVSDGQMDRLWDEGRLLVINKLHGARYGTPRAPIEIALGDATFPLIDWPVSKIALLRDLFPGRVFTAYLLPPSAAELARRLQFRDRAQTRLPAALEELDRFASREYDEDIDIVRVNTDVETAAGEIWSAYLAAIEDAHG